MASGDPQQRPYCLAVLSEISVVLADSLIFSRQINLVCPIGKFTWVVRVGEIP